MPGIRKRKKLPEDTVESTVVPLTTRKTPNQVASRAASGGERRATATVPAIGAHSSRRALQKYSRRLLRFSCRCAQSRSTYRSTTGTPATTPSASRVSSARTPAASRARAASTPPASAAPAQSRARTAAAAAGCARASAATTGAATKSPFDGFMPTAKPTTSPAAMPRAWRGSGARAGRAPADEQQHHRLEVGEAGEAERPGQELLDVALVVVVAPERDHGERQHHPDGGGEQAERASGDPRAQLVERPEQRAGRARAR